LSQKIKIFQETTYILQVNSCFYHLDVAFVKWFYIIGIIFTRSFYWYMY